MLLKNTAYVWTSTTMFSQDPCFVPMIYTSPNQDGSYSGNDTTTCAAQLNQRTEGNRVVIFQGMLSQLFGYGTDAPPFYDGGIASCQKNVATYFTQLHNLGIKQLDAVIPDVEGAIQDWEINSTAAERILSSRGATEFLHAIRYSGGGTPADLSFYIATHREIVEPVLAKYADRAIYAATKPIRDLYGNIVIQKGSICTPRYAASVAVMPWDAGDTPNDSEECSDVQCDELYGACNIAYKWTAQQVANAILTRVAVAKSVCSKPIVPWIAPKSYDEAGSYPISWANSTVYDSFLDELLPLTNGTILYWRPPTAVASDDLAIASAINRFKSRSA